MPANVRRLLVANIPENYRHVHYVQADENGTRYTYALFPVVEATPADVAAAFIAQCRADGRAESVHGMRFFNYAGWNYCSDERIAIREAFEILGLSALLEPKAGSEEGEPCED